MSGNLLEWFPLFSCHHSKGERLKGTPKYYLVANCIESAQAFRVAMHLRPDECSYVGSSDQLRYVKHATIILLDGWAEHRADRNDIWFELKNIAPYCRFDGWGVEILHEAEFIEKMN